MPLLPQFESGEGGVNGYHLETVEETIGVNDAHDVAAVESYLRKRTNQSNSTGDGKLRIAMFSGGRGTGAITEALLRHSDIELTLLVNTYDDGLSTGLLRRFIPGMLGPSDVRKNISRFLAQKSDPSSQALLFLIEYRFPDPFETIEALSLLESLIDFETVQQSNHELLCRREQLSLAMMRKVSQ